MKSEANMTPNTRYNEERDASAILMSLTLASALDGWECARQMSAETKEPISCSWSPEAALFGVRGLRA